MIKQVLHWIQSENLLLKLILPQFTSTTQRGRFLESLHQNRAGCFLILSHGKIGSKSLKISYRKESKGVCTPKMNKP